MAKTRRAYTGGAASTTTSSNILSSGTTSFTITAYTGWPYGSDPFFVVVEPGTANEEKILVTRTGSTDTTINVYATPSVAANRGADGTSSVAHSSGATVFPVFTALDADEANELTSAFGSKGDLVSYGSSTFETLGVGTNDEVLIADSGEASGLKWGSVDTAQLADDAVTTAKIDDGAVDTAQLAADAVTSPKISLAYADSSARTTALPSPAEGDLSYLSDTDTLEVYDGSAWAAVGGGAINLVATATPSAVSSASIDNCFTADYANYMILYQNTAASAANNNLTIRLRASSTDTTANYYYQKLSQHVSTVTGQLNDAGTDEFEFVRINTTYPLNTWGTITLFGPAVAAQTLYSAYGGDSTATGSPTIVLRNYTIAGYQSDSTAFDGFTLLAGSGTFSGKVLVYGIADS